MVSPVFNCSRAEEALFPDAEVDGLKIYMFKGVEGRGTYDRSEAIRKGLLVFIDGILERYI